MSSRTRRKSKVTTKTKTKTKTTPLSPETHAQAAARSSPPCDATFAVASDGTLFINIGADGLDPITPAALKGRPIFIGAALREDEAKFARDLLENAAHELRSKITHALATGEALVWSPVFEPPMTDTEATDAEHS